MNVVSALDYESWDSEFETLKASMEAIKPEPCEYCGKTEHPRWKLPDRTVGYCDTGRADEEEDRPEDQDYGEIRIYD